MARVAISREWILAYHSFYIGGQIEIRRWPEGILRGSIKELYLDPDAGLIIVVTEWTAVLAARFPDGFGLPVTTGHWSVAEPTAAMPDPTRFEFVNDTAMLAWPEVPNRDGTCIAEYTNFLASPARRESVELYPRGHALTIAKPS